MYVPTAGMGRYRGMGDVMPPCTCVAGTCMEDGNSCSSPTVDTGNVCDTTSKMFDANLCNNLYVPKSTASTSSLSTWLNANAQTVAIGAAVVVGLFLFTGRR